MALKKIFLKLDKTVGEVRERNEGTFKSPFFTTAVKRRYLAAMMTLPIVKWRSSLAHSSDQMLNRRVILNLSPEVENSQNRLEFMTSFIKTSIETEKMENNKMVKWEMLNAK